MEFKKLKISVHELVDFLLRRGHIDTRIYSSDKMKEGTKIHSLYQRKQESNYLSEQFLKETFIIDEYEVTLEGRADGIILSPRITIDEIKSTIAPLEEYYEAEKEWHLGQAKCYALMFAHSLKLKEIAIRLTYISQVDNSSYLRKEFMYPIEELEKDIHSYLDEYISFYRLIDEHILIRNSSSTALNFPFPSYRKGQRTLAKYVYGALKSGGMFFIEAPTGIGKTISTIFPAVKIFSSSNIDKIFYLTAKNSGKEAALLALKTLCDEGMKLNYIEISAKEKSCLIEKTECNPDKCPFTIDYYAKLRKVIQESLANHQDFTKERIRDIAIKNMMCPFELSLDLSLYSDVIVCDYNYVYDPEVYLKRFFDEGKYNLLFLVDEAHNLVERARKMYSASLSYASFKKTKYVITLLPDVKAFARHYKKLDKAFKLMKLESEEGEHIIDNTPYELLIALDNFITQIRYVIKNHEDVVTDDLTDFLFDANSFLLIDSLKTSTFVTYVDKSSSDLTLNIYCLDPSNMLRSSSMNAKGTLFFSATLSPSSYYVDLLGGEKEDPFLSLHSPFKKENLAVLVAPYISTKYKNREKTYIEVSSYIKTFIKEKKGNYFVYLPSYEYLTNILPFLDFPKEYDVYVQEKDMGEQEKEEFLSHFSSDNEKTTVGLLVIGGAFGEGIDLVGERLIGVVIVGVGLPQLSFERNLIKDYYDEIEKNGYEYSYLNVGLNKVMQAVGRLIRSESDVGAALLIDDRYLSKEYLPLFENKWSSYKVITKLEDINQELRSFYTLYTQKKDANK